MCSAFVPELLRQTVIGEHVAIFGDHHQPFAHELDRHLIECNDVPRVDHEPQALAGVIQGTHLRQAGAARRGITVVVVVPERPHGEGRLLTVEAGVPEQQRVAQWYVLHAIWYEHPQYETYGTAVARLNDDGTATMTWYGGLFYDIVGEPTLVALENGRLHLNCRQRGTAYYARHILEIAVAGNVGTLVDHWIDTGLPDPHCEGSLTRLSGKGDGKPSRLVFVNCNSTEARSRLTARVSYREGAKGSYSAPAPLWPDSEIRFEDCLGGALAIPVQIDHTGGYSAVCRIDDTHFAVLAQKNSIKPGGAVSTSGCLIFAIFSIGNAL